MGGIFNDARKQPMFGRHFENPYEQDMLNRMQKATEDYHAYRPEAADARLNALQQQMQMFAPLNNALGQMYGGGAMFNLNPQMPFSPEAFDIGKPPESIPDAPSGTNIGEGIQRFFTRGRQGGSTGKTG